MKINWQTPPGLPADQRKIFDFLRQRLQNGLTVGDNMNAAIVTLGTAAKPVVSGTEFVFANPLKSKPIGFEAIYATDDTGAEINLAGPPRLNLSRTDGRLGLLAVKDLLGGAGDVGELLGPITRARAAATSLTSSTAANVCTTTSITLAPGKWSVRGFVAYKPSSTASFTEIDAVVSATSATLPASSTIAVPTNGEVWVPWGTAAWIPGSGNDFTLTIPPYRVTVATGATLPLYLVARAVFTGTGATCTAYGALEAVRESKLYGQSMIVTGILWGG